MEFLSNWLKFVALFKIISSLLIFKEDFYKNQMNNDKKKLVNPLFCRILQIWFFYTGVVSLLTTYSLDNKELVLSCFISYLIPLPYLINEFFIHKTYAKIHALHILPICLISIIGLFNHLLVNF
ncbi:hypothetical protein DICPUDRAFT_83537 [Dictyostelium purpureum]|uniref:Uncharacterized protein n=1 Tax=Dictyostelium purpureum TaxID=5786 RepID=F0ZZT9_DICPU|nr:uncharacterized protein DICPUDRAFT_83537 [Dictyostelium purpureum]EGC30537.1 hypothetical protein DICPUDRAFT_83537 [Dictyostelium purpureum]|eukprot:XP_003292932.1 hypothetical protein DICPUDRAFT_83537 [Dictyostelium purpureum]